jgi:hypothetical protein
MTVRNISAIEKAVSKAIEDSYVKEAVIDRMILDGGIRDVANRPKRFLIIRDGRYELYAFNKREMQVVEGLARWNRNHFRAFLSGEYSAQDQSDRFIEDGETASVFTGFTCDLHARRMLER